MKLFESDWMKSVANQVVTGVNSALAMSPGSQKHLKNLEHCILKIHLKGLDSDLYFGVAKSERDNKEISTELAAYKYHVQLVDLTDSPDVTIIGSPIAFIKLLSQKNKAPLFQSKELKLEGDSVRIQQILAFVSTLQIDWDGLLANFIGDVPAHLLGSSIRSGIMWGLNFSQSLIRDTEEFIKYELRLLPDNKRSIKQFSAISKLSEEVEKLKSRFDQLDKKPSK
ncbi:MAG: ubiquinone biosynthesis protein UbiJ [Oleiphilaceae bacterium]|jgi:ubiquinone biosynthesis protein UbiJ